MPSVKFTDVTVANLKQGEWRDAAFPAFGLRVGKHARTFIVNHNKSRKRLGRYPKLSLSEARKKALTVADEQASATITVAEAVTIFLSMLQVKPRTRYDYTRLLNRHLVPALGKRDIHTVTGRHIIAITDKIFRTPSECRHAHVAMNAFFNWARKRTYIATSPMAVLDPPTKHRRRERILTDDELIAVWRASDQLGVFGRLIKLCFLTAARRSEIPAEKKLSDRMVIFLNTKNGKDHHLPITPYMRSLFGDNDFINHGWSKNKIQLDKISGVSGYVLHDIRRTTASNMARLDVDPFLIERVLNHTMPSLQATYNRHSYVEAIRKPLEIHQGWLLTLVGSEQS